MKIWSEFVKLLPTEPTDDCAYWYEGDDILCRTDTAADRLADVLEFLGCDCVTTGYFDPEEDEKENTVDKLTGWFYVTI